eukprot:s1875_g10.t1
MEPACCMRPPGETLGICFGRHWELHFAAGFGCALHKNFWKLLELVFEGLGAAFWSWFLLGSEGNVAMVFCSFGCALHGNFWSLFSKAWELHFGAGFFSVQKATGYRFRPSVPWRFAVWDKPACWVLPPSLSAMVFCCFGCALQGNFWSLFSKAWELHFGAGFFSVQKATLGTGTCLLGTASVPQRMVFCCFGCALHGDF